MSPLLSRMGDRDPVDRIINKACRHVRGGDASIIQLKEVSLLRLRCGWVHELRTSVIVWPTKPVDEPEMVIVNGGSTATGTLVIQLLKLYNHIAPPGYIFRRQVPTTNHLFTPSAGMQVVTTCSPHNFELVTKLGADHVLDYNSESCVKDIKKLTRNSLRYATDCVSDPETMEFCYKCIGRLGGRFTALEPPPRHIQTRPRTVTVDWVLGPTLSGKSIGWPAPSKQHLKPFPYPTSIVRYRRAG